jgi:hypothetical protein
MKYIPIMQRFPALIAVLFTCILSVSAQAYSYENAWKSIDKALEQGYPETALSELDSLIIEASRSGNLQQKVKATMYQLHIRAEKDPTTTGKLLQEAEAYAASLTDSPEKMIMYTMLVDSYALHMNFSFFFSSKRSELKTAGTELPENLEEWSEKDLKTKINSLTTMALKDTLALQQQRISTDNVFVLTDTLKQTTATTLYDLVINKLIESQRLIPGYFNEGPWLQRHLAFRRTQPEKLPLIMAELQWAQHCQIVDNSIDANKNFIAVLDSLATHYASSPEVVEILVEKASLLAYDETKSGNKRIAFRICEEGIARFPDYPRIHLLKNIQYAIQKQKIIVSTDVYTSPKKPITVQLETTNLQRVKVEVHRLNATAEEYQQFKLNLLQRYEEILYPDTELVDSQWVDIVYNPDFAAIDTQLKLKAQDVGIYEIRILPPTNPSSEKPATTYTTITNMIAIRRAFNQNQNQYFIVDRLSGKPISGVTTSTYQWEWNKDHYTYTLKDKGKSDKHGKVHLKQRYTNHLSTLLSNGKDSFAMFEYYGNNFQFHATTPEKTTTVVRIFTDRSIYRPGQPVYYKAIAYAVGSTSEKVIADTLLEVSLRDINYTEIEKQTIRTNSFGSAAGSFILPDNSKKGIFRIGMNMANYIKISVEEYKKPGFEVEINSDEDEHGFGKTSHFTGKATAFAGYPIQLAKVNYKVFRKAMPFFRYFIGNIPEKELIAEGSTETDAFGNFTMQFTPAKPDIYTGSCLSYFRFSVETNVTSQHGETQFGTTTIPVGERSLILTPELPAMVDKDKAGAVKIKALALNGQELSKNINYQLFAHPVSKTFAEAEVKTEEKLNNNLVLQGVFTSTDSLRINWNTLSSGDYSLVVTTLDTNNDTVTTETEFILFSEKDKKPAVKSYTWQHTPTLIAAPGSTVVVRFGTSVKNARVLYEVLHGGTTLEQKWVRMSNQIKTFKVHFKESYKTGITVRFTLVQDGKVYHKTVTISESTITKQLKPVLSVFRDKLQPGANETWTVRIPEALSLKKSAELLASMYDASLDKFVTHSWHFNPNFKSSRPSTPGWEHINSNPTRDVWYYQLPSISGNNYSVPTLDFYNVSVALAGRRAHYMRSPQRVMGNKALPTIEVEENFAMVIEDPMTGKTKQTETVSDYGQPVKLRENFNETVFFYPQLYADTAGNFNFSFTLPESLTRWKLNLLAHTADLYAGTANHTVVSQKELMVEMNLPRFVRQGDNWLLQASVVNLTDSALTGSVQFQLMDPVSDTLITAFEPQQFQLAAQRTQAVSWEVPSLTTYDLVVCRIEARSGTFSDGEMRYLPVLSDRIPVTESVPFMIQQGETKEISFTTRPEDESIKQVSLEFTARPIWTAIQALPVLASPESDNTVDLLGAWYSAAISRKLVVTVPELTTVFRQLTARGIKDEALVSKLEQNKELHLLLLKATPWLRDAAHQTEQLRQLQRILDVHQQAGLEKNVLAKLRMLQVPSGAFVWMQGMSESRYITQLLVEKMERLYHDPHYDTKEALRPLLTKAIEYLDDKLAEDFARLKKHTPTYREIQTISVLQVHYLTLRATFKEFEIQSTGQEAFDYYGNQIQRYARRFPLYSKALAAQYFHRTNQPGPASDLLRSLKEMAVKDKNKGMYWAKNTSSWIWHERPLSIHTRLLETFNETGGNENELEMMKLWLLNQKRAQSWDNRLTTLEAVMALVTTGERWMGNTNTYTFTANNTHVVPTDNIPGSGYSNTSLEKTVKSITIQSAATNSPAPAWGALYRQSLQRLDKVQASGKELSIRREYYLQHQQGTTKTLEELSAATTLEIGDRIISRLVITAAENYEYVVLKDNKAAALEVANQLSSYTYNNGLAYYRSPGDAATEYFFDYLPKGTYILEEEYYLSQSGDFSAGNAAIQCMYAPEYTSYSAGSRWNIKVTKD